MDGIDDAADSDALILVDAAGFPNDGPPPHFHDLEDELLYVLEGSFEFLLGEPEAWHHAGPGTLVHVPAGTLHTSRAGSRPAASAARRSDARRQARDELPASRRGSTKPRLASDTRATPSHAPKPRMQTATTREQSRGAAPPRLKPIPPDTPQTLRTSKPSAPTPGWPGLVI